MAEVRTRFLDCLVLRIELSQELGAGETAGSQRVDNLLHLGSDDVALRVNSEFWNRFRISRSVNKCWISISSTFTSERSGFKDARHSVRKSTKASLKGRFLRCACSICSRRDWARSGMRF